MEHQVWKQIIASLTSLSKRHESARYRFSSSDIVRVILWAVLHDRPISWATDRRNWPIYDRRRALPSNTTVSRRYRSSDVQTLLKQLESLVLRSNGNSSLVSFIDGKSLPIGGCTKDKQAGYGRSASGMAKGYKLHALISLNGSLLSWRLSPMNTNERRMARRLLRDSGHQGYVLGDGNYDSNPLHAIASEVGQMQLISPRRKGTKLGHQRHEAGRLRSSRLLEDPFSEFGKQLFGLRSTIERYFAHLTNWGGSLTTLPAWARTHKRVHRWVQGKLIVNACKRMT